MKIIDIINKKKEEAKLPLFSFEYFPPKTDKGVENLFERLDRMSLLGPSWVDVTWGAGGSTSQLTLEICHTSQNYIGLETMMHMTCTNMPREALKDGLQKAKESGIQNILALRGDPPRGETWKQIEGGFANAIDLVRFIKEEFGNWFGIAVAGYPEGHAESKSYEEDLKFLKAKVDAGADVIITQLFYDVDIFLKFVKDCKAIGINCPIIPGLMPIHGFAGFERMTTLCKTFVPKDIREALEPIKHDDEAVKNYGVKLGIDMCRKLMQNGVEILHFYTLNLEKSVTQILEGLSLVDPEVRRPLPWRSMPGNRGKEDVRPIFWKHRPHSYMQRTQSWDEFPNGRWGDSRSPAFGELTNYHLATLHVNKSEVQHRADTWGRELKQEADVFAMFVRYVTGEINSLPWCDQPLSVESSSIQQELVKLNKAGCLTINSQPRVNGLPSSTEGFGWGPKGGYVYQKAYVECFLSPALLTKFLTVVKNFPSITYHAVNLKGDNYTNAPKSTNALTWGVFPGKEILQPTVVDHDSFLVWKDEAFLLWKTNWLSLYPQESSSSAVLSAMINSWFLLNVVDNNFIDGEIFQVFDAMLLS